MKFNALIPELSVKNIAKSLDFYLNVLGFKLEYERADDKFAFISFENAQFMIEQVNGHWETGALEYPFGRGINFQISATSIAPMLTRLNDVNHVLFRAPRDEWYRVADKIEGQREFLVMDPDGYLLRFCESLGSRDEA